MTKNERSQGRPAGRPKGPGKKNNHPPKGNAGKRSERKTYGRSEDRPGHSTEREYGRGTARGTGQGDGKVTPRGDGKTGDRERGQDGKSGSSQRKDQSWNRESGKPGSRQRTDQDRNRESGKPGSRQRTDQDRNRETGKPGSRQRTGRTSAPAQASVRLNRYIASAGICSRREADQLITAGLVSVNGKVVTELGTKVMPGDDVRYNGERLGNERKVYLLLNKPKDYVTTVDDPHAKKTVMELVAKACSERIYPVGRLDKNTTGVLLFTNDGELTRRLTHPSFNKKKVYHVFLDRNLSHGDLNTIAAGIELDDGFIQPDAIAYASQDNKHEIGLEIHSGRNRIVRRIFEHLGYKVTRLDRVYFAGLTKKNLPRGRWRFLTEKEIKMLKMNAFE